jgi:hypothetical protein
LRPRRPTAAHALSAGAKGSAEDSDMPLTSAQLTAMVERAKLKAPPAPPPPTPAIRPKLSDKPPKPTPEPVEHPTQPTPPAPPPRQRPEALPLPTAAMPSDDFPIGWDLRKESWHFHRRFHAIFKRPMHLGEYSHLLWQIRRRTAEHLWEDCWRVRLPDGRTLPVRATPWRLITILPKYWQPPQLASTPTGAAVEPSANAP